MNYLSYFFNKSKLKSSNIKENYFSDNIKEEYFDFDLISKFFNNIVDSQKNFHIISDKIKTDLDIDEIFTFIDRTSSKIGQQYFYSKIRIINNIEELYQFEKLINIFENDKNKALKFKKTLSKLNNNSSYYFEELFNRKQIEKPKWISLIYILSVLSVSSIFISFINIKFLIATLIIFLANFILHYLNKPKLNYYITSVSEFYKSIKVAKSFEKDNNVKDYFSDLSFLKNIYKINNKIKYIAFEKGFENNEITIVLWSLYEQIKILFNIETILFYRFIDDITKEKENIKKLFCFIGEIDTAISISELRKSKITTCKPNFTSVKTIDFKEITHPLIENCVPNSLKLNNKSLLLTGSNMSGKTTFIRTVSINSILAQTINTCFAKEYKAPFFKIFSSIRISDNLFENTSYFLEEVKTIKEFISASNNKSTCFFVLDEIFKGTNTKERISAGNSILSFLNKKQHFVFVSTHDIELTELLEKDNYELYHFQEQIINNKLIFDHKLKQGKLKTKNAIRILELNNYPKEIIDVANSTLSLFSDK